MKIAPFLKCGAINAFAELPNYFFAAPVCNTYTELDHKWDRRAPALK